MKNIKSGFTILELSIIIIVISIIVAGVIKGVSLVRTSKITNARALTTESKINEIDGIIAWYETTLKDSFVASEMVDGSFVSTWYDISSQENIAQRKNTLSRMFSSGVSFRQDAIASLPSLEFSGNANFSLDNLASGNQKYYSIFTVLMPKSQLLSGVDMRFIDSYIGQDVNKIGISNIGVEIVSANTSSVAASFEPLKPYLIGVYLSDISAKVFVNNVDAISTFSGLSVNGFKGLTIGSNSMSQEGFVGYISEIIIFNRILNEKERIILMSYLAKKYKIRVEGAVL
jgi:competence protein ComGC